TQHLGSACAAAARIGKTSANANKADTTQRLVCLGKNKNTSGFYQKTRPNQLIPYRILLLPRPFERSTASWYYGAPMTIAVKCSLVVALVSICIMSHRAFGAADWQIIKVNGHDYLTIENISKFYGL